MLGRAARAAGRRRVSSAAPTTTTTTTTTTVGFVGLGNMGRSMARNLVGKGRVVHGFDVHRAALDMAIGDGVRAAASPADVARASDVVFTMLRSPQQVDEVYRELFAGAKRGTTLIDCSTVDPATSRALDAEAARLELRALDAPVSGGVTGASQGTLTFMVGGEESVLADVRPLFEAMGKGVVYCGPSGCGQIAKLVNNLILGISMIGVAEGMNMGIQLGIDPKVLSRILSTSTARCWSVDTYNPVPGIIDGIPSSNKYKGGFGCALMLKDLKLALQATEQSGLPSPMGQRAAEVYSQLVANGKQDLDFAVVYDFLKSH